MLTFCEHDEHLPHRNTAEVKRAHGNLMDWVQLPIYLASYLICSPLEFHYSNQKLRRFQTDPSFVCMINKREFIASLSSHRPSHVHYPGAMTPLTLLVTGYCLKRGACSSSGLLQTWHAALVLKIDDPKKSWQQCNNRTRTTPFMFLKIQAVLFSLQGTASEN